MSELWQDLSLDLWLSSNIVNNMFDRVAQPLSKRLCFMRESFLLYMGPMFA